MLFFWQKLMGERGLSEVNSGNLDKWSVLQATAYLESPSKTEDAVVSLFGRKTLERQQNRLGLLGDQVVSSIARETSAHVHYISMHT